jgi:hypothetical protein
MKVGDHGACSRQLTIGSRRHHGLNFGLVPQVVLCSCQCGNRKRHGDLEGHRFCDNDDARRWKTAEGLQALLRRIGVTGAVGPSSSAPTPNHRPPSLLDFRSTASVASRMKMPRQAPLSYPASSELAQTPARLHAASQHRLNDQEVVDNMLANKVKREQQMPQMIQNP